MTLNYEGWCRRIDLNFRAKYPFLKTKIYKIHNHKYNLVLMNQVENFLDIAKDFDSSIRYITAPIQLINKVPIEFEMEIDNISDNEIPSNFSGLPFTLFQLSNHITSIYPQLEVSEIKENHESRKILIELVGKPAQEIKKSFQDTLNKLKNPYAFEITDGGVTEMLRTPSDEVFNITSSKSKKSLNCSFLERDEELWFKNVESIYNGSFTKENLYFFDSQKTCCLVDFSKFKSADLRNHLLLYDIVYCVLPLAQDMYLFLQEQKISRDEILYLLECGRLKILNIQPESRLDYGFLNEAFQTNQSSVVSRRALSALCAIDLVNINKSYIFNDSELEKDIFPLLIELSKVSNQSVELISNYLLWPKYALRTSFDALNQAGPMGIARYGVNKPIMESMHSLNKSDFEFEFMVHSQSIHLAHALDATYFPFFVNDGNYTDHPYVLMMGNMLNFFKTCNYDCLNEFHDLSLAKNNKNPSIQLISTFEINNYIPIQEFEQNISSSIIRKGMSSLFSELSKLDEQAMDIRIGEYNAEVEKALASKGTVAHALDLGEDVIGLAIPFFGTGKKLLQKSIEKSIKKFPTIQKVSEFIEDKTSSKNNEKRNISLLTRVNRVVRLKKKYK